MTIQKTVNCINIGIIKIERLTLFETLDFYIK